MATSEFGNNESSDIQKLFDAAIKEYAKSVSLNWHLTPPDIDDVMNIVYERDEIEDIIHRAKDKKVNLNTELLDNTDCDWQNWVLKCLDGGEVKTPLYDKPDEPKEKWWLHIESLDKII